MQVKVVTYDDAAKVVAKMDQYAARGQQTTPVMEEIALDMLRLERIIFHSNGRRGGGSWRQLKPDTIRKKGTAEILRTRGAKPGYSHPGNDALYNSLTVIGAPGQILRVSRREVEFGTEVAGADITQKTRPFLRFLPTDIERWKGMITRWLLSVK